MATKDNRYYQWTFITYPDSLPDNWESILNSAHLTWCHSPLHDSDLNGDETEKKPHYHCIIKFGQGNKKSYSQIEEIISPLNCTIPKPVGDLGGLVRYFIHLDNPEKHQYSRDDIVTFGSWDIDKYFEASAGAENIILREMLAFVVDEGIEEFCDLLFYAAENKEDWFYVLTRKYTYVVSSFIKSYSHKLHHSLDNVE